MPLTLKAFSSVFAPQVLRISSLGEAVWLFVLWKEWLLIQAACGQVFLGWGPRVEDDDPRAKCMGLILGVDHQGFPSAGTPLVHPEGVDECQGESAARHQVHWRVRGSEA